MIKFDIQSSQRKRFRNKIMIFCLFLKKDKAILVDRPSKVISSTTLSWSQVVFSFRCLLIPRCHL